MEVLYFVYGVFSYDYILWWLVWNCVRNIEILKVFVVYIKINFFFLLFDVYILMIILLKLFKFFILCDDFKKCCYYYVIYLFLFVMNSLNVCLFNRISC